MFDKACPRGIGAAVKNFNCSETMLFLDLELKVWGFGSSCLRVSEYYGRVQGLRPDLILKLQCPTLSPDQGEP